MPQGRHFLQIPGPSPVPDRVLPAMDMPVMDQVGHPALLLVDTFSSSRSVEVRHAEWKVGGTVSCSQQGFMLPPGLGFHAICEKARAAAKTNRMPRSYWDWEEMLKPNTAGVFPHTPAANPLHRFRRANAVGIEGRAGRGVAWQQRPGAATRPAPAPSGP